MSGAEKDYNFGSKRHWRRWVWNRITELTPVPRDALCVYLPGKENYDLPLAEERGFKRINMIGVEKEKKVVRGLRTKGSLTVDADIFNVVNALTVRGRTVDVVFADLCSGLKRNVVEHLGFWLAVPGLQHSVFAFNMLRGRDPETNVEREIVAHIAGKHRGQHLFYDALFLHAAIMMRGLDWLKFKDDSDFDEMGKEAEPYLDCLEKLSSPKFSSYRSDTQTFDSLIFRNPLSCIDLDDCNEAHMENWKLWVQGLKAMPHMRMKEDTRTTAAFLAHRAMRMH